MPQIRSPRRGSLQFWPRRRAKGTSARVRSWADLKDAKPLGFAGYKVGMTHLIIADNRKTSTTKGMDIVCPATIIECPPIKIASIRFYKKSFTGLSVVFEKLSNNLDKELSKKISLPKKKNEMKDIKYDFIRLLVYTQPKLTGIGKKKPEIFELGIGGQKEEQLKYAESKLGKEITINEVFKEGQQLDIHAITTAKGVQGPVKRFGVRIRNHKSEKSIRNPGSLGGWIQQGHTMWRQAKAGKMGYHTRTEYNKWLISIKDGKDLNPKSGFHHFGVAKNTCIVVRGSIAGTSKRLIRFNEPIRPNKKIPAEAPTVKYTNLNVVK